MKTKYLLLSMLLLVTVAGDVAAQQYNLKEITSKVQMALDDRKDRYNEVKMLKAQGVLGENNRGYLTVLVEQSKATMMVEDENHDRKIIYQAIADQNNLSGALATIETVFAQVQREKAESGESIQFPDGSWGIK